ncbi:hypothetical protein ACW69C_24595 [Streptomyces sp. MN3]
MYVTSQLRPAGSSLRGASISSVSRSGSVRPISEGSVEVGGVRGVLVDGAADQLQRLAELLLELRRDHVLLDPPCGPAAELLGQLALEVAGVDVLLDVEHVPQYDRLAASPGHQRPAPHRIRPAAPCGGRVT